MCPFLRSWCIYVSSMLHTFILNTDIWTEAWTQCLLKTISKPKHTMVILWIRIWKLQRSIFFKCFNACSCIISVKPLLINYTLHLLYRWYVVLCIPIEQVVVLPAFYLTQWSQNCTSVPHLRGKNKVGILTQTNCFLLLFNFLLY